ncbi:hypothetical protein D3C71_943500 [compost metagenome]
MGRRVTQRPAVGTDMELSAANIALHAVNFAHKLQHEAGHWLAPQLFRLINLFDIPLAHHHHAIGDFHRLFLIVGHEDAGEFQLFM